MLHLSGKGRKKGLGRVETNGKVVCSFPIRFLLVREGPEITGSPGRAIIPPPPCSLDNASLAFSAPLRWAIKARLPVLLLHSKGNPQISLQCRSYHVRGRGSHVPCVCCCCCPPRPSLHHHPFRCKRERGAISVRLPAGSPPVLERRSQMHPL